jgi:hypothetical protein
MDRLIFEKVGDINFEFPYLCVYLNGDNAPFMEIAVSDTQKLRFTIYEKNKNVELTAEEWSLILERARLFLPKVLKAEKSY